MWTEAGSEFGSEKGYIFLIVRALYGSKSSGAYWRDKLAETLNSIGYSSTQSDHDIWIKRETTQDDTYYYKYILVYVYNVLRLAKDEQEDMLKLNQVYRLKEYFGPPDRYLGANIDKVRSMNCV